MIIELFGLPGSGKTTLAKTIEARTDFRVAKVSSISELLLLNLVFLMKHPIRFAVMLWYIIRNSPNRRLFYYKFMNLFLHHNAKYQKALRFQNAILDQGYFQNVLSVFERRLTLKELQRYVRFLVRPDMLVVLSVPQSVAQERVKQRWLPRQEFGDAYMKRWRDAVEMNNKLLKENIDKFGVKHIVIDAARSVNDVCEEMLPILS
ncbi:AAA family ATPase [Candidatus Azambacteria bacterium]|nr:AAA family ATPase [Candidatus Azambacteria bacterium]MBI3685611.1 AAA family ATPase [Candidatus Azambacteria bacterium]